MVLKIRESPVSVDVAHEFTHKKGNEFTVTLEELRLFGAALGPFGNGGGVKEGEKRVVVFSV